MEFKTEVGDCRQSAETAQFGRYEHAPRGVDFHFLCETDEQALPDGKARVQRRKCHDALTYRRPGVDRIEQQASVGVCGKDQLGRRVICKQRIAMARGHSKAPFRIET